MGLSATAITNALMAHRGVGPMTGPAFSNFARGLGQGVMMWALGQPQNLGLTGVATGTLGVGTVVPPTTRIVVAPSSNKVLTGLRGVGITGEASRNMAHVVAFGVAQDSVAAVQIAMQFHITNGGQAVEPSVGNSFHGLLKTLALDRLFQLAAL